MMLGGPKAERIQDRPWNSPVQAPEAWKENAVMLLVEFEESETFEKGLNCEQMKCLVWGERECCKSGGVKICEGCG